MLSVELTNLATILDDTDIAPNISLQAKKWSQSIKEAFHEHAVGFDAAVTVSTNERRCLDRRWCLCIRD